MEYKGNKTTSKTNWFVTSNSLKYITRRIYLNRTITITVGSLITDK
jgi:hypothetical protein